MRGKEVPLAGLVQRRLVWEVPLDGQSFDPSALGNRGDGRVKRAVFLVQLHRPLDDALPGLGLSGGARAKVQLAPTRCFRALAPARH